MFGLFLGLVLFFRLMGYEQPLSEPSFSLALLLCMALLLEAGRRVVFRSLDRLLPSPEARFRRLLEQGARRDLLTGGPGAGVDFLLDYLMTELRPSFTALSHVDAEHQRLRISRSRGRLPPALRRLDVALDSVVAQRLLGDPTYVVHPDLSDRERGEWAACGLAPVEFAVPLRFGEQVLGALIIGRTRRVLSRSDVELLLLLAQVTAYGIRQTRRLEDAERALENRGRALTRAIESLERESDSRLVVEPEDRFAWVGRLAAGVAHEASKPLYVIRHHLARLERTDERDRHRIDSIKSEVRHVSQLIGDLQVYARSHTLVCEPLSIRGLLDELVAEGRHSAEVDIVGEANIETRGDPALLGTLFRSLLENACEAGARRVSVKLGRDDRGVVVLFADDGPGVPPELGDHIFEPFFSTKEAGRASGLGLAIAREIARSHGGGLELSSAERGAAFELRLPFP
ncbi:MAG: ATP-binding protein [Myxococcota bacterium]